MFGINKITGTIIGVSVIVILGLGGWLRYQSNTIDNLRAVNQAQAQTIQQQEDANKALTIALQQERDAVIAQQQRNDEIERVATENAGLTKQKAVNRLKI